MRSSPCGHRPAWPAARRCQVERRRLRAEKRCGRPHSAAQAVHQKSFLVGGRHSPMLTLRNLGAPPQLLSFIPETSVVAVASKTSAAAAVATPSAELHGPRHVLLLTDIGRDVDDTVATMALLGAPRLALCGVVTCGGCASDRQALAQCWLHALGARGVPVVAGDDVASAAAAHCHLAFTPEQQAEASRAGSPRGQSSEPAPAFIVRMARTFKRRLLIVAIGPMGPLQAALQLPGGSQALRHIGGLMIQGQAESSGGESRLRPSAEAFNLREDMKAANAIFEQAKLVQLRSSAQ